MKERLTRAQFLKLLAGVGIIAGTGLSIKTEIDRDTQGFESPDGRWLGLYENHVVGHSAKDIPPQTDILYAEFVSKKWITYDIWDFKNVRSFFNNKLGMLEDETWQRYDQGEFELVLADVFVPEGMKIEKINSYAIAGILGAMGLSQSLFQTAFSQDLEYSRRNFLFGALFAWGVLPMISDRLVSWGNTKEKTVQNRLTDRIDALLTATHPMEIVVQLRTAMTALKLILLARSRNETLGRKPLTVLNAGSRHSNIEDFILAGEDFCRTMIEIYLRVIKQADPEWLATFINENGGPEMVASVLVFNADFQISAQEVEDLYQEGMSPSDLNNQVYKYQTAKHKTRYYDEQLLSLLVELLD